MATSKLSRIWKSPFDKEIDGLSLRNNYYSKIWSNSHSLYHKDLLAHHGCVNAVEFSDDGIFMASGGDDKRVFVWRTADILNGARSWPASSQVVPRIMDAEHSSNVFCLSVPLDGALIFSGGNDQKVIEHNTESGAPQDYYLHEGSVFSIAFQPGSEKVFVTACDDGQLQLFDRNNPSSPIPLVTNRSPFYSVVFHPTDSQMLASANAKDGVNLWDIRHLKKSLMNYPSERGAMSVRFDSSGRRLLVLGRRQDPVVYDIYNSNINKIRLCNPGYLNACTMKTCTFAGDNDEFAVSGSDDHCIYVWKVPLEGDANEAITVESAHFVLKSHRSVVNNVRYCPSAGLLASCGVEKMVKIWSAVPLPNSSGGLDRASSELHEPRIPHAFRLPHLLANETFTTEEDTAMLTFFDMLVERSRMASSSSDSSPEEDSQDSNDPISSSVLGILLHGVMPRSVVSSSSSSSEHSDSDDSSSHHEEALLSLLLNQFLPIRRSENDSSESSSSSSSSDESSSDDEEPKAGPSESSNEEEEEPEKLELPPNLFSPTTSGNRRPTVNVIASTSNETGDDEKEEEEEHVPFTAGRSKKNRQLRKRKLSSSSSSSD